MPMTKILEVELFYLWGIDSIGPFISFYGLKYILVVVDYLSRWIEVVTLAFNKGKSVLAFLRQKIFISL